MEKKYGRGQVKDLTGIKFGRLTALKRNGSSKQGKAMWDCLCSCGNTVTVISGGLVSGNTTSCGCYKIEVNKEALKTHGMSKASEYGNWCDMRKRCLEDSTDCKDYALRGITVHEDFSNSFTAWLDEIGRKPKDGRRWSVGRIDNNLGYTYGNLRWELDTQQARNHSRQANNTTGFTGVQYSEKDSSWIAQWKPLVGNNKQKYFSTSKFGYEEAKHLAIAYRAKMVAELNAQGAGYAESHGADK